MKQTINFNVPQGWHELSDEQLRYAFTLIAENFTSEEVKILCLFKWSKSRVLKHKARNLFILQQRNDIFEITPIMLAEILPHIDWLAQVPTYPVRLSKIRRHIAIPADFQDVPFQSYIMADNLYQGFLHTKSDDLLDQLASVLYGAAMKLMPYQRINVFYWMASLKTFFARRYPDFLHPTQSEQDNFFGPSPQSVEDAMNAQIRALTKGDVTKEKEILALDTWRALNELNAQAREYHEMNKQMNKHGK